jgi:hypothetical protein
VAGCNDKGAFLSGPDGTLAVGAYVRLTFGDACNGEGGSGKVPIPNFCSSESVTEVLELSSSDPSVVVIITGVDDPRGANGPISNTMVGKNPGQSILTFKGRFSDGTVRQATATVRVKAPDSIKLVAGCGGPPATNLLALVGTQATFDLEIYAGSEKLVGWLPNAATADGVTQGDGSSDGNHGAWQAPSTPMVLQLQSAVVSKVTGTLTAFGPDQVTGITLESITDDLVRAAYTQSGDYFYVSTSILVQGQSPCNYLPVEIHSSTPAVCSGPAGETVWPGDDSGGGKTVVHAEGDCTLGVSMPGGPVLATKSFPIFFVSEPPSGLQTPGFGTGCTVEGGTACAPGYSEVGLCKSGYWVEKPFCPLDQVCDFVPDTTSDCVAGVVCAQCRGLR